MLRQSRERADAQCRYGKFQKEARVAAEAADAGMAFDLVERMLQLDDNCYSLEELLTDPGHWVRAGRVLNDLRPGAPFAVWCGDKLEGGSIVLGTETGALIYLAPRVVAKRDVASVHLTPQACAGACDAMGLPAKGMLWHWTFLDDWPEPLPAGARVWHGDMLGGIHLTLEECGALLSPSAPICDRDWCYLARWYLAGGMQGRAVGIPPPPGRVWMNEQGLVQRADGSYPAPGELGYADDWDAHKAARARFGGSAFYHPGFRLAVDPDELNPPSDSDGMESPDEGGEQLRGSDMSPLSPAPQAASPIAGGVAAPVPGVLAVGEVGRALSLEAALAEAEVAAAAAAAAASVYAEAKVAFAREAAAAAGVAAVVAAVVAVEVEAVVVEAAVAAGLYGGSDSSDDLEAEAEAYSAGVARELLSTVRRRLGETDDELLRRSGFFHDSLDGISPGWIDSAAMGYEDTWKGGRVFVFPTEAGRAAVAWSRLARGVEAQAGGPAFALRLQARRAAARLGRARSALAATAAGPQGEAERRRRGAKVEQAGGKWEKVMRRMDRAEQDAVAAERAAGAAAAGAAPEVKASAKGGRGRDRGRNRARGREHGGAQGGESGGERRGAP